MSDDPVQRWGLALSGVLTELNGGFHHELGGWGKGDHTVGWCRNVLAKFWGIDSRASFRETTTWLWQRGHRTEALLRLHELPADPGDDDAQAALLRAHAAELQGRGLLAWDLGRFVAVVGWGAWAGFVAESEAWRWIHGAATWSQRRYRSWEEFGRHYELGRRYWAHGEVDPKIPEILAKLNADPKSPWVQLRWDLALGEPPAAPPPKRIKRTICRACGAPKQVPPQTGWVYCDRCGTLTDWDFRTACSTPGSMLPGPAYEVVRARLQPKIDAARSAKDADKMRTLQVELFGAWADACPAALPPRAKQPAYKAAYVKYLAEAAVAGELDAEWTRLGAELFQLTRGISFEGDPRKPKVRGEKFWPLTEVVERQVARGHQLYAEHGVDAMHPDGIPAEMQLRMTWSVFAQGWLPYLYEPDLEKLLARSGLGGEYVVLEDVETRARSCGGCGSSVQTVPGAKVVVCEACGNRVDVAADDVGCTQCGTRFALGENQARGACPSCQTMVDRA